MFAKFKCLTKTSLDRQPTLFFGKGKPVFRRCPLIVGYTAIDQEETILLPTLIGDNDEPMEECTNLHEKAGRTISTSSRRCQFTTILIVTSERINSIGLTL